ncbi:MAG TPA: mechanosensitive ion channel domain-containing protein [Burkholderiales bacterium]|nr:mechanosensitive ion channel domain-containing protein [Burkholderiales bacterium]
MRQVAWGLIQVLVLAAGPAGPASTAAADTPVEAEVAKTGAPPVPLVIENRTVVVLRAHLLGHPPSDRVEGAQRRIERLIETGGAGVVTSHPLPQGIAVDLDGTTVFVITPGDVDELAGATLQSTAEEAVHVLSMGVTEAREQSSFRHIVRAVVLSMLGTLLYAGLLYAVIVGKRRITGRVSSALRAHMERLKVAGVIAVHPRQFLLAVRRLLALISWAIGLFATYLWLGFVLGEFPYTRAWGEQLKGYLVGLLGSMLQAMLHAVPGLVTVVLIVVITRAVVHVVDGFFGRVEAQHIRIGWLDQDTARPTRNLVIALLWLFALVMAYPYLPGAQTEAFKGLSVLVGLMVSIGASSLVGQAASGMILMYSRALRTGEYVKIGDSEGTVTEMGLFATRVQTGTGEELVLPNAYVVANTTRNFSRGVVGPRFALQVTVTIGYSTPWRQVHAMLLEAARRTSGVAAEPEPYVIQTALSDFYVEYKLVAFAGSDTQLRRPAVMNELNANVQDVFNEYGVQIMSPHYMMDPAHPQIVPKERWFEAPADKRGASS